MSLSVSSRLARAAYLSLVEVLMEPAGWTLPAVLEVPKPDEEVTVIIGALYITHMYRKIYVTALHITCRVIHF